MDKIRYLPPAESHLSLLSINNHTAQTLFGSIMTYFYWDFCKNNRAVYTISLILKWLFTVLILENMDKIRYLPPLNHAYCQENIISLLPTNNRTAQTFLRSSWRKFTKFFVKNWSVYIILSIIKWMVLMDYYLFINWL